MPDGERLARLEVRVEKVEEFANNSKNFMIIARDFFSRADERAIEEEKQRNKRDQEIKDTLEISNGKTNTRLVIAGLVVAILALLVGWLTYRDAHRADVATPPPPQPTLSQPQLSDGR